MERRTKIQSTYFKYARALWNKNLYALWKSYRLPYVDFIFYTGADTVYTEPSITLPKFSEDYSNHSKIVLWLLDRFYKYGM